MIVGRMYIFCWFELGAGFDSPTFLALKHCLLRCFIGKQCLTQIGFDGDRIGSREEEKKSDRVIKMVIRTVCEMIKMANKRLRWRNENKICKKYEERKEL